MVELSELSELCEIAMNKFGYKIQIIIAMEELAELSQALSKYLRYHELTNDYYYKTNFERYKNIKKSIINEIVDVEIMIEQIKQLLHSENQQFYGKYRDIFRTKLEKLRKICT